jgi:EAL domain-containing protein (putative c-di-GMP-specific phosphodiesterase class I)
VAVAEGVETRRQLTALQRLGCGLGQGYLWSPPRTATDIDALMGSGTLHVPSLTGA